MLKEQNSFLDFNVITILNIYLDVMQITCIYRNIYLVFYALNRYIYTYIYLLFSHFFLCSQLHSKCCYNSANSASVRTKNDSTFLLFYLKKAKLF